VKVSPTSTAGNHETCRFCTCLTRDKKHVLSPDVGVYIIISLT
jgi:hypothetical protein